MNLNRSLRNLSLAIVCALGWMSSATAADVDEFGDLVARIQFDYYAADARSLTRDVQAFAKLQVGDPLQRTLQYQLAYGYWKLAEVLLPKDKSGARKAASDCIDASDKGLEAVPKRLNVIRPDVMHAEIYAIQAGCALVRDETYKAGKAMDSARALQPANPRVLLVDATLAIAKAKTIQDRASAEKIAIAAVGAFDAQPPASENVPDWGHAEALARLGALQLQMGNRVTARNSIERALVLASDYVWARDLLGKATGAR